MIGLVVLVGALIYFSLLAFQSATVYYYTVSEMNRMAPTAQERVVRVSGKTAGVVTLAGDLGKGWLAGWSAHMLLGDELAVLTVALSVILGHIYSVFVQFRGGKGVATGIGAVLGVAPWTGAAVLGVWLAWFALFRYSSGAALLSFGMLPVLAWAMGESAACVGFSVVVAALIVFRHKENVIRLWHGTEPRAGGHELT